MRTAGNTRRRGRGKHGDPGWQGGGAALPAPTKNFEISRAFYETLGFTKLLEGDVAIFAIGDTSFILQRFFQKDWAENCMMQLMADDLGA